jgi:ketosteroid isomerase-like protein
VEVDRPDAVAEVAARFAAYEQALVDNDVDAIIGFFAVDAVRFGVADHQADVAEQLEWRLRQPPLPVGRRLHDTRIIAYGADVAVVTTFFSYPGSVVAGRQSQTWVRLPVGWRIVTAHVSEPAGPCVDRLDHHEIGVSEPARRPHVRQMPTITSGP